MKKKDIKIIIFSFIIIITLTSYSVESIFDKGHSYSSTSFRQFDYIDITVEEAWNFLNDTSNGIQIPIDVRTDSEWKNEHIDTPEPENPMHHDYSEWNDDNILIQFISQYNGNEIIVYCRSGSRSISAINILIANGFNGIIYNMLGGINSWKAAGFPTKANQKPENPVISGEISGKAGEEYEYTFKSSDPENDELYYFINWSDNTSEEWIGPYASKFDLKLFHNWSEQGTYLIQAKVRDKYGDESNWSTIEVSMPYLQNYQSIFSHIISKQEKLCSLINYFIFYNKVSIHF